MKRTYLYSMLALCVSAACHAETYPAPIGPSQSDFGGVGLLQTPTARMAREGEISLNYRDNDQYRYYSASVQLFPWLETTLRYTDVRTKQYSSVEAFSGDQTYKDKAFDVKLRLWEESYRMPQVPWAPKILAVPACLMRNTSWPARPGAVRLLARSGMGLSRHQRQREKPVLLLQR